MAALYFVCARIGQFFAIDPGNVTPVWIPSGVMLALSLKLGSRIWLGVFLGAFAGNIWAYFSTESLFQLLCAVASATFNGVGDVLSTVVAAQLIIFTTRSNRVLENHRTLFAFIGFGVLLGPLASALFGSLGLWLFGHITSGAVSSVFETWLLGDAVGALVFAPLLLAWLYPEDHFNRKSVVALLLSLFYSLTLTALAFDIITIFRHALYATFLFLPLLFYVLIHYGQRIVLSVQSAVLSLAVIATSQGQGPFKDGDITFALIQLQVFAAIFSMVLFVIAILNLERLRGQHLLEKRTLELEELYRKDALTKLWNRYRIKEFLDLELGRYRRKHLPFGILMLDIDDFKQVNDQYGHLEGDRVLSDLASLIQHNIREIDFLGRWGGEEFIIIVSETSEEALVTLAEKINRLVESHTFSIKDTITLSIGIAVVGPDDNELTLLDRADAALYLSKNNGKNQSTLSKLA